jgi:nucleotide-binding universal stress UspA family protein
MFRRILIAHDGSEGAKKALVAAINLAKRCQAELHSISVEEHLPLYAAGFASPKKAEEQESQYFLAVTQEARDMARKQGVALHTHILPGHEVDTIVRFAREHQIDLLVIGFMGHSRVMDRIWGSTSQSLAQQSPCQVLVIK